MKLGNILGSISPAFGMASGNGLFGNSEVMGSISPLYGMASGDGMFGDMGGMGMLGGAGGNFDLEQLMKLLQGGQHDPNANYLNMFGG